MPSSSICISSPPADSVLTYPLAIIRGTTTAAATSVYIAHRSSDTPTAYPVHNSYFTAQYLLSSGSNHIQISTSPNLSKTTTLNLFYEPPPPSTPHVRLVYLLTSDTDPSFQSPDQAPSKCDLLSAKDRISTAAYIIQSACAEMLNHESLQRRTFHLDPSVNVHRLPFSTAHADSIPDGQLWSQIHSDLSTIPNRENIIDLCVMSFSRMTSTGVKSHTALGGSYLALFGGASLFTWPQSVSDIPSHFLDSSKFDRDLYFDDSAHRMQTMGRRACTATTIGALLHELGHCFSLHHPIGSAMRKGGGIMARGFDDLDRLFVQTEHSQLPFWDRGAAVRLRYHPFLQFPGELDMRRMRALSIGATPQPSPSAHRGETINGDMDYFEPQFEISNDDIMCTAPAGVGMIAYYVNEDLAFHQEFLDKEPVKVTLLSLKEICEGGEVEQVGSDKVQVSVIDVEGRILEIRYNELQV